MDLVLHAKVEYTKQLQKISRKGIYNTFVGIFEESKSSKEVLKTFQTNLVSIPNWNQDTIHMKFTEMTSSISEELFEKLIQAIVVSNVKIFGAIKKNADAKIEVTLPDPKQFVHKIYVQCARNFYQQPHLFDNRRVSQATVSKNNNKIVNIINESVEETIRSILPFASILEEYFKEEPSVVDEGELNNEIDGLLGIQNEDEEDEEEDEGDVKTVDLHTGDDEDEDFILEDAKNINLKDDEIQEEESDTDDAFFKE